MYTMWYTKTMNDTNKTGETVSTEPQHKWERAGLGKAPFRYAGHEYKTYQACHGAPVQVGGSCDYCYTGISNMFWFVSADGNRFKVGEECANKSADKKVISTVKKAANDVKRIARHEKEYAAIVEARTILLPNLREKWAALPHPTRKDSSLWDWAEWMMANAGNAGKMRVVRAARKAQEGL